MVYSKASNEPTETTMKLNEFSIQGPIYSFDKAHKVLKKTETRLIRIIHAFS